MLRTKKTADDFVFVSKFTNFKEAFKTTMTGRMLTDLGIDIDAIPSAEKANMESVAGKIVIGTCPLFLSTYAKGVIGTCLSREAEIKIGCHASALQLRNVILEEYYYITATIEFADLLND